MLRARCGRQAEIGSQEGRAKLGHKLLLRIAGITPPLATETPVKTLWVAGPMNVMPMSA